MSQSLKTYLEEVYGPDLDLNNILFEASNTPEVDFEFMVFSLPVNSEIKAAVAPIKSALRRLESERQELNRFLIDYLYYDPVGEAYVKSMEALIREYTELCQLATERELTTEEEQRRKELAAQLPS